MNSKSKEEALGGWISDNIEEFDVGFLRAHPFIKKTQILMKNE